jgi:hypothetical protein
VFFFSFFAQSVLEGSVKKEQQHFQAHPVGDMKCYEVGQSALRPTATKCSEMRSLKSNSELHKSVARVLETRWPRSVSERDRRFTRLYRVVTGYGARHVGWGGGLWPRVCRCWCVKQSGAEVMTACAWSAVTARLYQ